MISYQNKNVHCKIPNLIKWAGGKNNLVEILMKYVPQEFETYYEPFFGGGAMFWNLKIRGKLNESVISDLNSELIKFLKVVRDRFTDLYDELCNYADIRGSDQYYRIRDLFNSLKKDSNRNTEIAAMFLYLNRNSYNGLWRTNKKGDFNVPYGFYKKYYTPSLDDLMFYSNLLQGTKILNTDFSNSLKYCKQGDFVYLDPPYYNERVYGFTKYYRDNFTVSGHKLLKETTDRLTSKGALVMESNYDTILVRNLYANYTKVTIEARHNISCKPSSRMNFRELIITNFNLTPQVDQHQRTCRIGESRFSENL
jgi:DNA adenine methylase